MVDTARLRALAEESQDERGEFFRARLELSLEGPAILALLAERDALIHDIERHIAIASEVVTERDALAAQMQRIHDIASGSTTPNSLPHIARLAADALAGKEPT
jgi:hypothetical protein